MKDKRVLIVEDESIPALELKHELENMGCMVVGTVNTGQKAIEAASETKPDVVLMDIKLHGKMDGIEAAKKIQEKLDIPIVYLSAYSDEDTVERAKETRLYWFLQKPYFFDMIKSTIDKALETSTGI